NQHFNMFNVGQLHGKATNEEPHQSDPAMK
ncbi:MAG: hypothetical protein JWQ04_1234, partial [Pedosphaera sp.]|nr:hypothetical protein [Pedosphaera sp.]